MMQIAVTFLDHVAGYKTSLLKSVFLENIFGMKVNL